MKVVLFCGGTAACAWGSTPSDPQADGPDREPADPLAHDALLRPCGHSEFILCLGYKGDVIKEYFLNYNEALSNDFVLDTGGRARRAAQPRYRRLADHVRRHRDAVEHRRAL